MVNELKRKVHEDQLLSYIKLWAINHSMIKRIYWINVNMSNNYQLQIHLQSSIDNKKIISIFCFT